MTAPRDDVARRVCQPIDARAAADPSVRIGITGAGRLGSAIGTVDAGPVTAARLDEPAMAALVSIAYAGVPRDVGLRLLERTR
jgi:hypothetical protein